MSKWVEELPDGEYNVTIADKDSCKYMYNEVCCNDRSPWCCSYSFGDICKGCELFEKEDGVIEE